MQGSPNSSRIFRQDGSNQNQQFRETSLDWSRQEERIVLNGESDISSLRNLRNIILGLKQQFNTDSQVKIQMHPVKREDFDKRMILLESQVQSLMKRRIRYNIKDESGQRVLDYQNLLNQKQNQVVQLQKKIQNLEERLRRSNAKELELENHIVALNQQLRSKQQLVISKNQIILSEVATANIFRQAINKIQRNVNVNKGRIIDLEKIVFADVNISNVGSFEIQPEILTRTGSLSRTSNYQELNSSQQIKTRLIELFRQFEKLVAQTGQITEVQVQRILQGFLLSQRDSKLYQKCMIAIKRDKIQENYLRLKENFGIAAGIYEYNLQQLKKDNPNIKINFEKNLFDILQREKVQAHKIQNQVFIDSYTQKVVEVPVQDARTKHLLHLLAVQMKRLTIKYPQLLKQMDERLCEFFQQEIIDCIQVDQIDKLVNIVKYVPQVVKVENVYAYSSQKTRKVEFHLRTLIKSLLQQLQKIKIKTGEVLTIDEGVIKMIQAQIMDNVNVDDILKIFRVVPKMVQVQKIVQKIVEKVVQVPQVITIERIVQKIVIEQKIKQVQRIVNVPLQIPTMYEKVVEKIVPVQTFIQRVIEIPTIIDRPIYLDREVIKVVEVQVFKQKIVEVDRIIQVQKVVNHIQYQPEQVQVIRQVIKPVQKIVQVIKQVQVVVQKIVEKRVEVPQIIQIQKIREVAVPIIQYQSAVQVRNHVAVQHRIVKEIVQKPIIIQKIVERIVEVPVFRDKIVQVVKRQVQVVEVEKIVQKIIIQQRIKVVQKIVTHIVEQIKEVEIYVQKKVQIPVIHQKSVIVKQIVHVPVIQKVDIIQIKQVKVRQPLVIYQPKIVQVQKNINHYIQVPKIVLHIQQKIVEVPKIVERIKQVRVQVQKIIQKMVEVPKIIQVEKIVQKIVVVPRVIEKIIQVPQIVQKIVQKEVIREVIREVERRVTVPVIQQKIVEVQKQRIVYIEVPKEVQKIVEKLVIEQRIEQRVVLKQIKVENTVQVLKQVPKIMEVERIVPLYHDRIQVIEVQRNIIVPVQVAVPVDRVVQKLVPIRQISQKIIQVPQIIQKIVKVKQQVIVQKEIQVVKEKVVVDKQIIEVERLVPYIQEVIREVPTIIEKIVPIQSKIQQIVTAQQIVQKIIERSTTIPRVYQIQRLKEVLVKVPNFIQIQRIVPQIVRVNNYIQKLVQKLVEVPSIIEKSKQICLEREKVVQVRTQETKIQQIQRQIQKIIFVDKIKEVTRNINHIEKVFQIIDRIEQIPVQILSREQRLVQVPYILQKIVQKIVIMPQIVQVLKYVHEVCQSNQELIAVQEKDSVIQNKYRQLSKNLKMSLDTLLRQLRIIKSSNQFSGKVEVIEQFLIQLERHIAFPKIIKVPYQKIVQRQKIVQKIVRLPCQDEKSLRNQLSLNILVQKLILQLKRISSVSRQPIQLDDDIKLIFFSQLRSHSRFQGDMKEKFQQYAAQRMRTFQNLGSWTSDHQMMLNSMLQDRFLMAQTIQKANKQIEKSKTQLNKVIVQLTRQNQQKKKYSQIVSKVQNSCRLSMHRKTQQLMNDIGKIISESRITVQSSQIQGRQSILEMADIDVSVLDERVGSKLRQNQALINSLKDRNQQLQEQISKLKKGTTNEHELFRFRQEIENLRKENNQLRAKSSSEIFVQTLKNQNQQLKSYLMRLQNQISENRSDFINAKNQLRVLRQNGKYILSESQHQRMMSGRLGQRSGLFQTGSSRLEQSPRRQFSSLSQSQIQRVNQSRRSDARDSTLYYSQSSNQQSLNFQTTGRISGQQNRMRQETFLRTPGDGYKFTSPNSTGMKMTESIIRNDQSSRQSPVSTPYSGLKQQSREESLSQSKKGYNYYYPPETRKGESEKKDQQKK